MAYLIIFTTGCLISYLLGVANSRATLESDCSWKKKGEWLEVLDADGNLICSVPRSMFDEPGE